MIVLPDVIRKPSPAMKNEYINIEQSCCFFLFDVATKY